MEHHAVGARSRRPSAARGSARSATSRGSPVLGGAVDQVDGVDHHRLDGRPPSPPGTRRCRRPLARGRHMRGLWLKIWIASQPRSTPRSTPRGRPPWRRGRRLAWSGHTRLHGIQCPDEGQVRAVAHGRAAHRRREDGTVQLAPGARPRRRVRAADRGHRPRALDARERGADPRRAALARARLGRGARSQAERAAATPRRRSSCSTRARLLTPPDEVSLPRGTGTAATRARTTARCACGCPTRARSSSTT